MAEKVNTLVKIRNAEREAVNQFLQERFSEVFSKVKANQKDAAQTRYSGGSIIRPWGFKAVSTVQSSSDDALIVKLRGKPKFQLMGYIAMLLVIGSFLCLVVNPLEYWFCAVVIVLFYIALISERKSTAKKISQVLEEVKIRFS